MYIRDDNNYIVAASNAGQDHHPGWYWNAAKGSAPVKIQVMDKVMNVSVVDTDDATRDELYQRFTQTADMYADYQNKTTRKIPVLILTPQN